MLPEIVRFNKWLRRRSPHATTSVEYTKDLRLFFDWVGKPPNEVTLRDVDAFIEHCQTDLHHAIATVNRRLAAIRSFYHFLDIESDDAPANPSANLKAMRVRDLLTMSTGHDPVPRLNADGV